MTVCFLGLGSNVGDRLENLRAAVRLLEGSGLVAVEAMSAVRETEPVGEVTEQRDFYNAAVRIETELPPHALLDLCKAIEAQLGRVPDAPRHGPRPIDVDLLLYGELQIDDERLSLPHREIRTRRFVLEPLLELEPELTLPGGEAASEALAAIGSSQRVERVASL